MSIRRLITITVEQLSPPLVLDSAALAIDVRTALANLGGGVVVTGLTVVEHDVVLVEQESFVGQFTIEV